MTAHLITTEIKIATCPRCSGYVFKAHDAGLAVIADPTPLTLDGYTGALLAGLRTFDLLERSGRPWKLHTRTPASVTPPPSSEGRTGPLVVAEHPCVKNGVDASVFEEVDTGPQQAPATPGGLPGGLPRSPAPAGAQTATQGPGAAPRANHRLSDAGPTGVMRAARCDTCGGLLPPGSPRVAVSMPVEYTEVTKVHGSSKTGPGYLKEFTGVGTRLWAIHPECV